MKTAGATTAPMRRRAPDGGERSAGDSLMDAGVYAPRAILLSSQPLQFSEKVEQDRSDGRRTGRHLTT
jgi:hypothetical protein